MRRSTNLSRVETKFSPFHSLEGARCRRTLHLLSHQTKNRKRGLKVAIPRVCHEPSSSVKTPRLLSRPCAFSAPQGSFQGARHPCVAKWRWRSKLRMAVSTGREWRRRQLLRYERIRPQESPVVRLSPIPCSAGRTTLPVFQPTTYSNQAR